MWPTTDSSQSPVPADVRGSVGQFESVGPSVGVEISIYGCDIDCIGFRALAHFCFLRENLRCVIVYVQQVDLQSTCPTRRGNTCRWTEGKRGSQYKHKLCPNSEAAFFEGCIWRQNASPIPNQFEDSIKCSLKMRPLFPRPWRIQQMDPSWPRLLQDSMYDWFF